MINASAFPLLHAPDADGDAPRAEAATPCRNQRCAPFVRVRTGGDNSGRPWQVYPSPARAYTASPGLGAGESI